MSKRDVSALADLLARVKGATGDEFAELAHEAIDLLLPTGGDASAAYARKQEMHDRIDRGSEVDAALTLVERVLPGWWFSVSDYEAPFTGEKIARAYAWTPGRIGHATPAEAQTRPLAVVAAGLQALISEPNPDETAAL